jgi:hypothetical protein
VVFLKNGAPVSAEIERILNPFLTGNYNGFIQDKMHTKTGKKIALERHQYMKQILTQFYKEWDGLK